MWEAWEYLASLVPGRARIKEKDSDNPSSLTLPYIPAPAALSRDPEEVEARNGPAESGTRVSFSSPPSCGFTGTTSNAATLARDESSGSTNCASSAVEPNLEQLGQPEVLVDDESYSSPPHQITQRSGWSSPARGVATRRVPAAAAASLRGLKEIQLQKLGKLEALDRAWDRLYPNETEEKSEWPWGSLTEEQVALGRLDFRKFMVLLSALNQTGLQPENALSLDQMNALNSSAVEPSLGELRQREVPVDDEGYSSPPHPTQHSGWSSPARGVTMRSQEKQVSVNLSSPFPCTPAPALSCDPEEVEVHSESTTRPSSSSSSSPSCGFTGTTSNAAALARGESFGSTNCASSAVEPDFGQYLRQREVPVDDEGYSSPPHQTQRSGWSSPARGVATRKRMPAAVASPRGLKEIQLQKLGKLEALDRAWDRLYPNETEERFEWPWGSLTEEQVALGRLDFRKFMVLLSALSQTGLEPENALSLEQISALDSLPLEEIPGYIASEVAVRHKIPYEFFSDVKDIQRRWLEKDGPVSFECHVDENDVCKYKIVQQRPASTVLHRTFGGDRVMLVFFSRWPRTVKRFQRGIYVGLRRYRLWTFKDTGKEEFKDRDDPTEEDYRKAVRGYFVCTESLADIDLDDPNFKYITRIHAARCHIMNVHNVPTMSHYCFRSQLALSQSISVPLNIPGLEFELIDDLLSQTLDDKNKQLAFTDGAGEISLDVAKLIGGVTGLSPPSLIQHRTYKSGMALKGTFQVNHKLEGLKFRYRPSMRKVDDKNRLVLPIIEDSLEVLNTTSRKPRTASLCVDLIILLSLGGVPASFFEQLVRDAIEKIKNIFTDFELAMEEVQNSDPEFDAYRDETYRMLLAGFPMNHPYLQKNLRFHVQDRIKGLRRGCVPLEKSFYLMGTADPTQERILKPNQVAIAMEKGRFFCGKVLVYKNPGKHWGDVHLFDAVWDQVLVEYVGHAENTIFFSTQGDRPVVDEIAKADLDGDLFWICTNTEVISSFQPSQEPWKRPNSRNGQAKTDQLPPSKLSPEGRESKIFNKFIKACIESARPSSLKLAATYWKVYMDRLLMMKDEERISGTVHKDQDSIYKKIEQLINLFYRAVDADKNDDEVHVPKDLIPQERPHYMQSDSNRAENFYTSTSILGRLFDMTDIDANSLGSAACPWEDTLEYDPNFEYGQFRDHLEVWSKRLREYNRETSSKKTKEARAEVLDKYIQMFSNHKILDEASAIYYANYEHVRRTYRGEHDPSFYFAMKVAGTELYKIYAENLTNNAGGNRGSSGEPYVTAYTVRCKMLRPWRAKPQSLVGKVVHPMI